MTIEQLAEDMYKMVAECAGKKNLKAGDLTKAMIARHGDACSRDDCKQALRLLKVYADHPGVWITAAELKRYDPELDGAKPHVLKKHLPACVCSFIQSHKQKGSRLYLVEP